MGSGTLRLIDETDETREEEVSVAPVLTCNDHEAVLRCTLDAAGISRLALQVAAPMLRSGQLRRVLAPWIAERFTLVAAFASRRHMPRRTRAFLDHLIQHAESTKAAATLSSTGTGALNRTIMSRPLVAGQTCPGHVRVARQLRTFLGQ
jgi:DNA-binding transcriptional LysR family regulator